MPRKSTLDRDGRYYAGVGERSDYIDVVNLTKTGCTLHISDYSTEFAAELRDSGVFVTSIASLSDEEVHTRFIRILHNTTDVNKQRARRSDPEGKQVWLVRFKDVPPAQDSNVPEGGPILASQSSPEAAISSVCEAAQDPDGVTHGMSANASASGPPAPLAELGVSLQVM